MATKTTTKRRAKSVKKSEVRTVVSSKSIKELDQEPRAKKMRKVKRYKLPTSKTRDDVLDMMDVVVDNSRFMLHYTTTDDLNQLIKNCVAITKLKRDDKSASKKIKAYNESVQDVIGNLTGLLTGLELLSSKDDTTGPTRDDKDFVDRDD